MTAVRTNIHDLLAASAADLPDRPALSYRDRTATYAEVWEETAAVGALLLDLGVSRGDRVAIYLEKRIETVEAMFASSAAGALFVPINHVLKPPQVSHILRDSGARFLITSTDRLPLVAGVLDGTEVAEVILVGSTPVPSLSGIRTHAWPEGSTEDQSFAPQAIDVDPAAIMYTSGSTGKPKGVVLSHRNLIVGAESVSAYLKNTFEDVILSVLPLSFDAGLSQVTTSFAVGAHCVLMNYLLPREVPELCVRHGVTGITGVPPLWLQIGDVTWPDDAARNLRYWANTGGRMPKTLLDRLRGIFVDADPYLMYGLTEAFRSTYLDPAEIDRRPDSIGKAIPNAEVLVLRPDGTRCDAGEEGELVHRGALVGLGYWNDPARTAERYRPMSHPGQQWRAPEMAVWSGDTVVADEEGYLYFVGRTDDMIKTSGYRVSPTEIEEAAYASGLVRDVVALGVDEPGIGHRIVVVVTPVADELDVKSLIAAMRRALPLYMVPSQVDVRAELPRSPNGKFDRNLMKAQVSR